MHLCRSLSSEMSTKQTESHGSVGIQQGRKRISLLLHSNQSKHLTAALQIQECRQMHASTCDNLQAVPLLQLQQGDEKSALRTHRPQVSRDSSMILHLPHASLLPASFIKSSQVVFKAACRKQPGKHKPHEPKQSQKASQNSSNCAP